MVMRDSSGARACALTIRIGGPFADVLRRVKHCAPFGGLTVDEAANCASHSGMTAERTAQALARIEAALARIEQASSGVESATAAATRRHETLRAAVSETLRDLDILIGEQRE
jgi:hypothetical protein